MAKFLCVFTRSPVTTEPFDGAIRSREKNTVDKETKLNQCDRINQ